MVAKLAWALKSRKLDELYWEEQCMKRSSSKLFSRRIPRGKGPIKNQKDAGLR